MSTRALKVALFRFLGPNCYEQVFIAHSEAMEYGGTLRISELVTVDFPMLPPEPAVVAEMSILDARIAEITKEFAQRLDALKSRKAELLALTHEERS